MLAETMQLDGGTLVVLLALSLASLAVFIAAVVLGFRWAGRAGRGSQRAMIAWIVVLVFEGLLAIGAIATLNPIGFGVAAVIAGQVAAYVRARRNQG